MNEDDIVKDDLSEEGLGDIIRERDKKLKEDLDEINYRNKELERQEEKRIRKGEKRRYQRLKRKQVQTGGNTGEEFIPDKTGDFAPAPDRDMRTGEPIYDPETDQFGNPVRFAGGLLVEIFGNLGLDAAGVVADAFVPGAGTAIQAPGSAFFNWANQKIRGEKEINKGEMAAASAASLIPGLQPFRAATKAGRFYKSVLKGGTTGAIDVTGTKLGRGEEVTTTDLASGFVAGGLLGSVFGIKDGGEAYKALKNKINKGTAFVTDELNLDGTISRIVPEEPLEPATFLKSTSNTTGVKGQGSFGELPEDDDLSQFLLSKRNRYEVADLSLRNANIDRKSPYYDRLRNAARKIPKFIRRNDEGFLYFDYKLFRDSMESGTRNPVTGKKSASKDGRAYLELFETDLDQLIASGTSPATATTQAFKLFNMKEFHDTFKPAAQILGLTGTRTKGRMDVSNVHHIAALKTVMGLYDQLGFNSPMYKKVNAALKESLDGLGSETENFTRLIGGKADVGSPHYLAHMFLEDATGSIGAGEDFFSDAVLARMNVDDNFRISKARELGKIIADAAKVAEQAQDVYKRVAVAANETDYAKIQQAMDEMLQLDFIKFQPSFSGVNYVAKVRDKAEAGMYRTRNFDELLEDLVELQRAIPVGKPKAIVEILFSPQLRKAQKAFGKVVTKIEEKFGEDGVTGAEMRRILDKFDVRLANEGQGQIGMFEDIDDDLIDSVLNDLKKKKNIRRTRRNQEKYKKDPDIN